MNEISMRAIWNPKTGITDISTEGVEALSASQMPGIKAIWTEQRKQLSGSIQLSNFTDKLSREWAIETGIIENLYEIERGVTQTLIEHGFQAEFLEHGSTNKPREYVIQLLRDQKDALDGVFDFVKNDRSLSTSYVRELHAALLRSQDTTEGIDSQGSYVDIPLIKGDWKRQANSPVRNDITYTYCPPEQVGSEMDKLINLYEGQLTNGVPSEVQAAWFHHRFTQIHPFQDGNGRVARAIASLVLVKDGLFPFVVTRDQRHAYLDALEKADSDDLKPLVDLIVKLQSAQFRKATAISEALLVEENVEAALSGLLKAADKVAADKLNELREVCRHADALETDIELRLQVISPKVADALKRSSMEMHNHAWTSVARSKPETSHYFRTQIIKNAKDHIHYFADTGEYRSWVALKMNWSRRGNLVFSVHGFGQPFNGSLICAPFLEFRDADEEGQMQTAFVPLAEEGFVFFYNEDITKMLDRFRSWREEVITIALGEIAKNLHVR